MLEDMDLFGMMSGRLERAIELCKIGFDRLDILL